MAASEGGKEVVYIRAILQDFGFTHTDSTKLYDGPPTLSSLLLCTQFARVLDLY